MSVDSSILLSIVIPMYNEEGNVEPMGQEVLKAFDGAGIPFEVVFVDDASTDQTWRRILDLNLRDPRVRGLRHARNAGQSAAVWTGISHTSTPFIATLDGDLQNDPADLPQMWKRLSEGYDFVCGMRLKRQDSWVRRVSSKVARSARRAALGVDFRDTGCAVRVFKRETLAGLFPFNGLHRFLPVLVHGGGFKTLEVAVNHRPRHSGVSKYGVWNRLGRGLVDLFGVGWFQKRRIRPVPLKG